MAKENPNCNVCSEGTLKKKKKYRLSGPVVIIGYIFLIPSVLGILIGTLMLFSTGAGISEMSKETKEEIRSELSEANVPQRITEKVLAHEEITESEKSSLPQRQRNAVENATLS